MSSARAWMPRAALLALAALAAACGGDGAAESTTTTTVADGTFARIQRDILDKSCVSCHRAGDANARQSQLVLTGDSAYAQMVGVASLQQFARADGFPRVKPYRADSSLLYHKLSWVPGHHSRDYGQLMPMGTTKGVTAGQLEYVRRWIEAGAPRVGHVVDTAVLADVRLQSASFTPLAAPTAAGLQLKVDSFAVSPGSERELFVYRRVGNATDLYVTRIQSRMRPGSHHLLMYTFDESRTAFPCNQRPAVNMVRDIRNADGSLNIANMLPMACHVFFAGAMTQDFDYRFPPGVALRLPANASLDFNVHYVNRAPIDLPGEAFANLYTADRAQVQTVARTLNLANSNFSLPPKQRTTIRTVFPMAVRTTVLGLTSHMHALGERYEIRVRRADGTETSVYVNTDWEHPSFTNFETPLVLQPGDALVSVVTWNNVTDRTVGFGLLSSDEMNIIFGYAY
ncbi:MAG: hypothetical protein P3B76_08465 [Gemmatimonadota bacterium]|nr:hypothetical protein [Gemmatimonadota bacterium]